jgi:hypothetical protein
MVIERLFEQAKQTFDQRADGYYLYGHSAGGQFVHRMVLLLPDARFIKAYAANPGWWTFPDLSIDYPYGLGGIGHTPQQLRMTLEREMVIILGAEDNDPNHPLLRTSSEAMAQGIHRFERGKNFYASAVAAAQQLKVTTQWQTIVLKDVGHSNAQVARASAKSIGR